MAKVIDMTNEKDRKLVDFAKLNPGDGFLFKEKLHIKQDWEQDSLIVETGEAYDNMCGFMVEPVEVEIRFWRN